MSEEIFEVLLRNDISSDSLCSWLQTGPYSESFKLLDSLTVSKQDFIHYFYSEIRRRTKWTVKEKKILETPHKINTNKSISYERVTPKNNSSVESPEKLVSTEKRCRPKVKLFASPCQELITSPPFKASTPTILSSSPLHTPNRSAGIIDSPIWNTSTDVPTTPLSGKKCKSWNSGNEFFENTRHINKSQDDGGKFRSRTKLMLGDFIKESTSVKSKGRRIKPTKVSAEAVRALPVDGPFSNSAFHTPEIKSQENVDDRSSLKMECDYVKNKLNEMNISEISNASSSTPCSQSIDRSLSLESCKSLEQEVIPSPIKSIKNPQLDENLVTNKEILNLLANIFACLLQSNLCDNVMIELCYLINLATAGDLDVNGIKLQPFISIHNCCYFAVCTLQHIENVLSLLASTTLSLLSAIPAISIFAPNFQKRLEEYSRSKLQKSTSIIQVSQDGNVSFQYDTDNVQNFTSRQNFGAFRKQRDGLYFLLQIWEKNHHLHGWRFQEKMAGKVKNLLLIGEDPTNLMHFARLFRNQLLASCSIQCSSLDKAEEEVLELLPSTDRGRLSLLQARLSKPGTRRGPVPTPDFPGRQVFFQEFIKACGPGIFLHFLQLSLVDEILRLNDMEFTSEGNDNFVDELTQKRFLDCVSSAHILAKFLAYAEFLPYQNIDECSEQVLNLHNEMRLRVLPLFNIEECLSDAFNNHRLVITIPWLVAYLSLMDKVSAKLPVYCGIWQHLQTLRQNIPSHVTPEARFFIQLCLGWLFQVAAVQDVNGGKIIPTCENVQGLDELPLITEPVLYYVCPYLTELNAVLSGNSSTTGRHIRPTPTTPKQDKTMAAKQLELQLEENFLQNQSQSTKRTIQFVCERVASCAIKEIAAEVLPKIKKDIKEKYSDLVRNEKVNIEQVLQEWEHEVTSSSISSGEEIVRLRVQQSIKGLLGRDVAEAAVQTAIDLAIRQALEKVYSWIQSFAIAESVKKELIASLKEEKAMDDGTSALHTEIEFNPDNTLPFSIENVRYSLIQALEGQLTVDQLINTIKMTRISLQARPLPIPTERILFCMLAELLTWAYVFCKSTEMFCRDLAFTLKLIFRNEHLSSPLNRLFCPRNLELVKNQWALMRLIELSILLVDTGLISHEDASSQVNKFYEKAPEDVRKILQEALKYFNKST